MEKREKTLTLYCGASAVLVEFFIGWIDKAIPFLVVIFTLNLLFKTVKLLFEKKELRTNSVVSIFSYFGIMCLLGLYLLLRPNRYGHAFSPSFSFFYRNHFPEQLALTVLLISALLYFLYLKRLQIQINAFFLVTLPFLLITTLTLGFAFISSFIDPPSLYFGIFYTGTLVLLPIIALIYIYYRKKFITLTFIFLFILTIFFSFSTIDIALGRPVLIRVLNLYTSLNPPKEHPIDTSIPFCGSGFGIY